MQETSHRFLHLSKPVRCDNPRKLLHCEKAETKIALDQLRSTNAPQTTKQKMICVAKNTIIGTITFIGGLCYFWAGLVSWGVFVLEGNPLLLVPYIGTTILLYSIYEHFK